MLVRKTNHWRTILKMFVFQEENLEDFSFFLPFLLNTYNYLTHQALDMTQLGTLSSYSQTPNTTPTTLTAAL